MHKKAVLFLALLILGIIIFTGSSIGRQTTQNGVVTLTLNSCGDSVERQLMQQVLKKFAAKYPNIKVDYDVTIDQYMDVLKARLIGETAVDVFYLDGLEAPGIMIPGVLEPLDSYITEKLYISNFEPTSLAAFQDNGKTYGLPKDFSTLA